MTSVHVRDHAHECGSPSHLAPVVFIVGHEPSVCESLEPLIRREGWRSESFDSPQQFLGRERPAVPSCVILDISVSRMDSLELQRSIAQERTEVPIIVTSDREDIRATVKAIKAGAIDFLTKPLASESLIGAIRQALEQSRRVLARYAALHALKSCYATLTRREREVMALVVVGKLNKQVAGDLGISEITVKAHRGKLMQKMGAESLAQLVSMALQLRQLTQRIDAAEAA